MRMQLPIYLENILWIEQAGKQKDCIISKMIKETYTLK